MSTEEEELIRRAMSAIGRRTSERKTAAARANAEKRRGQPLSEEHKAKLKEAQAARRERERSEQVASGMASPEPQEKRKPGRPRKSEPGKTEGTQE